MLTTYILIALYFSVISRLALSLALLPLVRTMTFGTSKLAVSLRGFFRNMTILHGLGAILPLLLLLSFYSLLPFDITAWVYIITTIIVLIENVVVGFYATRAYLLLQGKGRDD